MSDDKKTPTENYYGGDDVTNHGTPDAMRAGATGGGAGSVLTDPVPLVPVTGQGPLQTYPLDRFKPTPTFVEPAVQHVFEPGAPGDPLGPFNPGLPEDTTVHQTAPPKPPIEFFAADRWEAMTHLHNLYGITIRTRDAIIAELHNLTHTGPVHVSVSQDDDRPDYAHGDETAPNPPHDVPQAFAVKPIDYVRV